MPLTSSDCDEDGVGTFTIQPFVPVNETSGVAVTATGTAARFELPAAAADAVAALMTNFSAGVIMFKFGDNTVEATEDDGFPVLPMTQRTRALSSGHTFTHVSVLAVTGSGRGHVLFGTAGS